MRGTNAGQLARIATGQSVARRWGILEEADLARMAAEEEPWFLQWWSLRGIHRRVFVDQISVGSAADDDIVYAGKRIQPRHCTLAVSSAKELLLDSPGGVMVQGSLTGEKLLVPGTSFRVGRRTFRVGRLTRMRRGNHGRVVNLMGGTARLASVIAVAAAAGAAATSDLGIAPPSGPSSAFATRDSASLLAAFGGDPSNTRDVDAVQQMMAARPDMRVVLVDSRAVRQDGNIRIESQTYLVSAPGQADRRITFEIAYRLIDREWVTLSAIPVESR